MTHIERKCGRLAATLVFMSLFFTMLPARAQYMSFFGDSTWKYVYTLISRPPADYLEYPPETPSVFGVYCVTMSACYTKDYFFDNSQYTFPDSFKRYHDMLCHDHESHQVVWRGSGLLYEDTVHGHLFDEVGGHQSRECFLICDMSLSEGDTFIYKGLCSDFYEGGPAIPNDYGIDPIDPIHIKMIVDSVRYLAGRKTIFLSLLDHQDDYFFGTGSHGLLDDYNLSIRFIEGVGPTYGLLDYKCYHYNMYSIDHNIHPNGFIYLEPQLGLLQCMYKDDSLVYMAHEGLGCDDHSCFGFQESCSTYPQSYLNLYPNPATQYVMLDLSTGEEIDGVVLITDMLGRQCFQQRAEGTIIRINVADLPTGMYFLTYTDGKREVMRKFLKR